MNFRNLRRLLYKAASFLGDINAVQKGPEAVAKRLVRKQVAKTVSKVLK